MPQISVKISEHLNQQLLQKAREMGGIKISDAVRILLQNALEGSTSKNDKNLIKKSLHYAVTSYYMLQEFILTESKEGTALNDAAHEKAEQIVGNLLKKK